MSLAEIDGTWYFPFGHDWLGSPAWRLLREVATAVVPEVTTFPDGEMLLRLGAAPARRAVIVARFDTDAAGGIRFALDRLLAVTACAEAAAQHGAAEVALVTPELPGIRQDRSIAAGCELASRPWICHLLAASGIAAVAAWHFKLDAAGLGGTLPVFHPRPDELAEALAAALAPTARYDVVVAPDGGAGDLAQAFGDRFRAEVVRLGKTRCGATAVVHESASAARIPPGTRCLIVDDMLVSSSTMESVTALVRSAGPARLDAFVWHARPTALGRRRAARLLYDRVLDALYVPDACASLRGARTVPVGALLRSVLRRALRSTVGDRP